MSNLLCGGCCAKSLNRADTGITVLPNVIGSITLNGSKLTILSIEKHNFGTYICVQNIVTTVRSNKNIVKVHKIEMHRYVLREMEIYIDLTSVPIRNALQTLGVYVNIFNDSPVTVYYTVNNNPANQVCTSGELTCAFPISVASLLQSIWYWDFETLGYILWPLLVVLRLNVPVNNFSVMSGRSHRFLGK